MSSNILEELKFKLLKSPERYEKQDELGFGGFGTVIKVKDKVNGNVYALKIINEYKDNQGKLLNFSNN